MAGFLSRNDRDYPAGYGQTWAKTGFIWYYKEKRHFMSRHGLIDVYWRGLSADGRVAFGQGSEPVPGAPQPDAPEEEWDRYIATPQGKKAMERGYVHNRPLWFVREGTRYRELPRFKNESTLPQRILSRDGEKIIYFSWGKSFVYNLKTGKQRQLTFGGAVAGGEPGKERNLVRAGDPDSPLFRWGRSSFWLGNTLLTDAEIFALQKKKELDLESPMLLDWYVKEIDDCTPSFDARYNLLSRSGIEDHLARGWIRGGFAADGALVGFIGEHDEASMGMLEVFPEARRHGFAQALEAALIGELLAAGRTPYCHVAPDNEASRALQAKLGLRRVDTVQCWFGMPERHA